MSVNANFAIIGGDERYSFLANSLSNDGNNVQIYGIKTKLDLGAREINGSHLDKIIESSQYIILPVPVTRDKKNINAPFWESPIKIDEKLLRCFKNKIIFCGIAQLLYDINQKFRNLEIKDYSEQENFKILNALPTAEGAIQIAMQEFKGTINSSRCLVVGYGRIGKILAKLLKNIGANVTVVARKTSDLSYIKIMGYKSINTVNLDKLIDFDIIFNTVPSLIFDKNILSTFSKTTLIIDLSSQPGGVDFEAAKSLGIKSIHALGLPGKFSPAASAEIIKTTIYQMIEEEKL